MVRSPIFKGTPTQSMEAGPISSTSPRRSSSACTSGVTSKGWPVRSTYSVSPLPGFLDGKSESRSEEHTSELQSQSNLVCRLLLEKKKKKKTNNNCYSSQSNSYVSLV